MSFWKEALGVVTRVAGTPIAAIGATVDAITSHKNIQEAWEDAEKKLDDAVEEAEKFGQENGHKLGHGVAHIVKHIVTKR